MTTRPIPPPFRPRILLPGSGTKPLSAKLVALAEPRKRDAFWYSEQLKPLAVEAYLLERAVLNAGAYSFLVGMAVGAVLAALFLL